MSQLFRLMLLLTAGLTAIFIRNTYVSNTELDDLRNLHHGRTARYF